MPGPAPTAPPETADVIIVGAGFSGVGAAIRLQQQTGLSFVILEQAPAAGGTWRDNTYPGCACDIPSHLYSFSFEPEPGWSRMYPRQQEIWDYLERLTDKHGLRPAMRFSARAARAEYAEAGKGWTVTTADGRVFRGRFLISAVGALSRPVLPNIAGLERFAGPAFHTAQWRHDVNLAGKRVAVIGSGASAIQAVPQIAPAAARLTLFQRTPPWILPKMDFAIPGWARALFRRLPFARETFRRLIYLRAEAGAVAFTKNIKAMRTVERIGKRHIARHIKDPALRAALTPDYTPGCKRILIANDFYPAMARGNVSLVTEAITGVEPEGVRTADGALHPADVLVLATGFNAADPLGDFQITGAGGRALRDVWGGAPHAYLGMMTAGFPNLFFMLGPNTGLGHNSMIYMIESQIAFILDALAALDRRGAAALAPDPAAEAAYNAAIQARLANTVWATGCSSWYQTPDGKNVTLWPGFTFEYRRRTKRIRPADFAFA